jgi:hypothetical protein
MFKNFGKDDQKKEDGEKEKGTKDSIHHITIHDYMATLHFFIMNRLFGDNLTMLLNIRHEILGLVGRL